jgi:hypothetical protein
MDEHGYLPRAKPHHVALRAAWQSNLIGLTLTELVNLAGVMIEFGKTGEAAATLAYVMNHADVAYDIYDQAEDLFVDLEVQLCPRVIADAKEWARIQTLRGAIETALAVE